MENHKKRLVTCVEEDRSGDVACVEEDRISNLPEHLIGSILERLSVQDALRTSVLSKKWRYRWTAMTSLVLDEQFSQKFARYGAFHRNGFIRIVNQLLILHPRPISKLSLYIPNIILDSFQEVDQWMLFLSRNSTVKELVLISNLNLRYPLPSHMFSCSELRTLKLENCIFKSPRMFTGFPNLEDLFLQNVEFRPNVNETHVVSLPQLQKLTLHTCKYVYCFNIIAQNLQLLSITTCPDALLSQFANLPCLTMVGITFQRPIEIYQRVEHMNLAKLLSILPNVQEFCIDGHFFKFLSTDRTSYWLPSANNKLNCLWLQHLELSDMDQLQTVLRLLQTSPNLVRLSILNVQIWPRIINYDVAPAISQLEPPNRLGRTLNQLETVEIKFIQGTILELLFIKLLLSHSPFLDKLIITPSAASNALQRLNIAKEIMRFPQASPRGEIIYLDPI